MTNHSVQKMLETETLVLTKVQLFWHYCIIGLFLIPPVMNMIDIFKYYVTNTYEGVRTIEEMATWSYLPIIPAIALYYVQKKRLKFKIIHVALNANKFIDAAKKTAQKLDWRIIELKQNLIIARSGFSWRSWGELITIIKDKDRILFNSICDPDNISSVASWGKNRMNLETFEQYVRMEAYSRDLTSDGMDK